MENCDEEDDIPRLSEDSLKALKEFLNEQYVKENRLQNNIKTDDCVLGTSEINENWQLSQFWYNEETTKILSHEIHRAVGKNGKVALLSCPTLYKPVKELCPDNEVKLFEYDKRFSIYGSDFLFYDYNESLNVPSNLAGSFDVVVLDPPFLSEECLRKTAETTKYLSKDKIILCTGAVMEELATDVLNVQRCRFQPKHTNNLANEFVCLANYNFDEFVTNNY